MGFEPTVDNPLTGKAGTDRTNSTLKTTSPERNERDPSPIKYNKINEPAFILPLITVWLQVRVLPAQQ